jgi:hypothetical protein
VFRFSLLLDKYQEGFVRLLAGLVLFKMSSLMAVTDRILYQLNKIFNYFILKQKSSEAIIALITRVLLHLILQ